MKKVADYRWVDVKEKPAPEEPAYALMERIANLVDMLHDVTAANVALVEETRVVGDYQGCIASKSLRFTNGKVFLCSTFGYDNSQYMPAVVILKNKDGAIKILINGKEYSGSFTDAQ